MSLIVETGTASSTSESYASVAYADTYHSSMGNVAWAALQTADKEQALRKAAVFMCQVYRLQWKGYRVNGEQALDWPRYNVEIPDLGTVSIVAQDIVPALVIQANAELALIASTETLSPNRTQGVVSKQVGPIKVVYDTASPQGKKYVAVDNLLQPLLGIASSGVNIKLRRV